MYVSIPATSSPKPRTDAVIEWLTRLVVIIAMATAPSILSAQSLEPADASFGAERWDEAAELYRKATKSDASNGAAWYGLARSLHEAGRLDEAAIAYDEALALSPSPGRTLYHLARLRATEGNTTETLRLLNEAQRSGMSAFQVLLGTPEFGPLLDDAEFQAVVEKMKPCVAAEYRHFDFWLGDWEVTTPQGQPAGTNRIGKTQGNCVLLEEWTSSSGGTGTSFNTFNTGTGRWQQFWVDAQGTVLELSGGLDDGSMIMTSDTSETPIHRITWTPNADGSVRQHWQSSTDQGKSWTTAFDGIYRKKPTN